MIVNCQLLTAPNYGLINCSFGDDGILNSGDVCSLKCNSGYGLNGSTSRTCGDDGTWSGSNTFCNELIGMFLSSVYAII